MNNTINAKFNQSNPSFGSFTKNAQLFAHESRFAPLIKKGEITLLELAALGKHKLEIDVVSDCTKEISGRKILGTGFVIKSPYNPDIMRSLTPDAIPIFKLDYKFEDVYKTLGAALKKALKITKEFDTIETEKQLYFFTHGENIKQLKQTRDLNLEKLEIETPKIMDGTSTATSQELFEIPKAIDTTTKLLSKYKDENFFVRKQEDLFLESPVLVRMLNNIENDVCKFFG